MKVRKELFKSKTLTNGEHPIAIRIHHKKAKLVMTGVSTNGKSSVSCPLKPSDSAPLKHSTMPP